MGNNYGPGFDWDAHQKGMKELAAFHEAETRAKRREELAKDLLLKIVETSPHHPDVDMDRNVRAAVEYTDKLLDELERTK